MWKQQTDYLFFIVLKKHNEIYHINHFKCKQSHGIKYIYIIM